ncbi:hypothetical protein N2152v2_001776 [Parachlorella kessleri]
MTLSCTLPTRPVCLQVWEDVRKEEGVHNGKTGPVGTLLNRYFQSEQAMQDHEKTKPHKRRIKQLLGARPHNQADADWAAGMGAPDNGQIGAQAAEGMDS